MIILSQRDARWRDVLMSPSQLTLGRFGCTTTCISMLSDWYQCFTLPNRAVDNNIKYTKAGLIIWNQINFPKFKFAWRYYRHEPSYILESLKDPKKSVILAIDGDSHWVVVLSKVLGYYWVADPWDGTKKLLKETRVSGSAHFISK